MKTPNKTLNPVKSGFQSFDFIGPDGSIKPFYFYDDKQREIMECGFTNDEIAQLLEDLNKDRQIFATQTLPELLENSRIRRENLLDQLCSEIRLSKDLRTALFCGTTATFGLSFEMN